MIITYVETKGETRKFLWKCQIECEECPFRFRCLTQAEILHIPFQEYIQKCADKGIRLITVHNDMGVNEFRRLK